MVEVADAANLGVPTPSPTVGRAVMWELSHLARSPLASPKPKEPRAGCAPAEAAPGPDGSATNPNQHPKLSSLGLRGGTPVSWGLQAGRQGRAGLASQVTSRHQEFWDREGQS